MPEADVLDLTAMAAIPQALAHLLRLFAAGLRHVLPLYLAHGVCGGTRSLPPCRAFKAHRLARGDELSYVLDEFVDGTLHLVVEYLSVFAGSKVRSASDWNPVWKQHFAHTNPHAQVLAGRSDAFSTR